MLEIHEAFYDSEGRVWDITQDAVSPVVDAGAGESVENLKEVIGWMLKACDQPVLDYDAIPEEGAVWPEPPSDDEWEDCPDEESETG